MMSLLRRSAVIVASSAAMMLFVMGGLPLGAQESKATKPQSKSARGADAPASTDGGAAKKGTGRAAPPDPTHRVPPGYAKLGLTAQQKDAIYKIQGKYYPQIQALEKQLDGLRQKRDAECEAVLTPAQRKLLQQQGEQKKAAAAARREAESKAVEKAGS